MTAKLSSSNVETEAERPDEDLADFDTPYWLERIEGVPMKRGHPKPKAPKVTTTIRLGPDVIEASRAQGLGWQSRINAALGEAVRLR